jgi:peptide/nickel transport system substrate-binding protein
VCLRPGPAATECGAGIASGTKLALSLEYSTGEQAVSEEVAALQSSFSQAGIQIAPSGKPFNTVIDDDVTCAKGSCWQMNYYGQGWFFDPGYNDPDGSAIFHSGADDNAGSYVSAENDTLDNHPALDSYQNYLAQQLPVLWMPQFDNQISAVSSKLRGTFPQDPLGNIYPENWYFVK